MPARFLRKIYSKAVRHHTAKPKANARLYTYTRQYPTRIILYDKHTRGSDMGVVNPTTPYAAPHHLHTVTHDIATRQRRAHSRFVSHSLSLTVSRSGPLPQSAVMLTRAQPTQDQREMFRDGSHTHRKTRRIHPLSTPIVQEDQVCDERFPTRRLGRSSLTLQRPPPPLLQPPQ